MYDQDEFYCEVQDHNLHQANKPKPFQATVQFLSDRLLITCMDARGPSPASSELYHPTSSVQSSCCPTFQQVSYRSIRFVMRRGTLVTLCGGLRKDLTLRLRPLMAPEHSLDQVLESIESLDCPDGMAFTPVPQETLRQFLGAASYQKISEQMSSSLKFWINHTYDEPSNTEGFDGAFQAWVQSCQLEQEALQAIARRLRTSSSSSSSSSSTTNSSLKFASNVSSARQQQPQLALRPLLLCSY